MPSAHGSTHADSETLRLDDALKLAGVAATGGAAKTLIQGGAVRVNGAVETRRKRKLVEGDVVEVGGETFEIAIAEDGEDGDEDEGGADTGDTAARDLDPEPLRAPGAGDLDDDPMDDEDDEDDDEDEDEDDEDDEEGEEEEDEEEEGGGEPAPERRAPGRHRRRARH